MRSIVFGSMSDRTEAVSEFPLPLREIAYSLDGSVEGIQINHEVDSCVCQGTHTARMISSWADMVYSNSICAEGLHKAGIALALLGVD